MRGFEAEGLAAAYQPALSLLGFLTLMALIPWDCAPPMSQATRPNIAKHLRMAEL